MLFILKTNFKIAVFFGLCVVFASGTGLAENKVLYQGVITAFKLNIRNIPSQEGDVITVVKKDQTVDVIGKEGGIGGWLTVVYQGQKGYVRNRLHYIKLNPIPAQAQAKPQAIEKKTEESIIPGPEKEANTKKSQEIKEKILTQEQLVQTFSQKEREIIEGLDEIDYALNKARLKVTALSSEINELQEKINQLNQDKQRLNQTIALSQDYVGNRLKALYKMNMIGRLDVAGMPTSVFDFFLQQNSMKRIIQADFNLIEQQSADFESLKTLEVRLQNDILAKIALESELNDQIRMNKQETMKRELILLEIRQQKRLSLAAVESLKEAQIMLDNRISNLQADDITGRANLSFSNYKGRLKVPVQGKIISMFGPSGAGDDNSFTFQKGIDIKVERGEPVKSVFKGEIMFAQWLKGYGNLLIVNHGDNYYTLYAHVEEIFKQKGETVEAGEVIATAGDTGSIKGMCLHFEVRHHGKPLNPLQWIEKGAQG
ncbi:MAG: peptidoglycan DD-metalloendopeptidase family protein [Pseudomonadota bacterium]